MHQGRFRLDYRTKPAPATHRKTGRCAACYTAPMHPPDSNRLRAWAVLGVRAALPLFWLLAFAATHTPARHLPETPISNDKIQHFLAYGVLGFLLTATLATWRPWSWRLVAGGIAIAALYGIFDELTQTLVGRTADLKDWIADVAGATAGSVAAGLVVTLCVRWWPPSER
jgi:VanZ family protein